MTIPLSWKLIDEFIELSNWRQAVETEIEVGEKSGSKKMKKKRLKTILDFGSFSTVRFANGPFLHQPWPARVGQKTVAKIGHTLTQQLFSLLMETT